MCANLTYPILNCTSIILFYPTIWSGFTDDITVWYGKFIRSVLFDDLSVQFMCQAKLSKPFKSFDKAAYQSLV